MFQNHKLNTNNIIMMRKKSMEIVAIYLLNNILWFLLFLNLNYFMTYSLLNFLII